MGGGSKTPNPTAAEIALAEVGAKQWNDYIRTFRPVEAKLIEETRVDAAKIAEARGQVSADSAAAFGGLTQETTSTNLAAGALLSSGRSKFSEVGDTIAQSASKAAGTVMADRGVKDTEVAADIKLTAFGRQLADSSILNMAKGAQRSTALAMSEVAARRAVNAAKVNALGAIAGGATRVAIAKNFGRNATKATKVDIQPYGSNPSLTSPGGLSRNSGGFSGAVDDAFGPVFP